MKNLLKSLAAFQNEVPVIHEDTKGYNYTYSNLNTIFDTIKPLLKKHGLSFTQPLDGSKLKTIIFHVDSGETLEKFCRYTSRCNSKRHEYFPNYG